MDSVTTFFYGLYMDPEVLAKFGIVPKHLRLASLPGYRLHLGKKSTVVVDSTATVYGTLVDVSTLELEALYAALTAYHPVEVTVNVQASGHLEAVCYIAELDNAPPDRGYAAELAKLAKKLSLPDAYCHQIEALIPTG